MFLHIGGETTVPIDEVVAIVDARMQRRALTTKTFLERARAAGRVRDVSNGSTSAFVVTDSLIYASPISSTTLQKRAKALQTGAIRLTQPADLE